MELMKETTSPSGSTTERQIVSVSQGAGPSLRPAWAAPRVGSGARCFAAHEIDCRLTEEVIHPDLHEGGIRDGAIAQEIGCTGGFEIEPHALARIGAAGPDIPVPERRKNEQRPWRPGRWAGIRGCRDLGSARRSGLRNPLVCAAKSSSA